MIEVIQTSLTLFQPVAIAVSLAYAHGAIARLTPGPKQRELAMGILFALVVVATMNAPVDMGGGYLVDLRNLLIFVATLFVGPIAGALALVTGIVMRLELGGAGAMVGSVSMVVSFVTGVMCILWYPLEHAMSVKRLSIYGVICSSHLVVILMLPAALGYIYVVHLVPLIVLSNFLGVILIGSLMIRETTLIAHSEALREQATLDPLTRLLNRRSLMEAVESMEPSSEQRVGNAVFYIDIDEFKPLNDTHGHHVGDFVLQIVSERVTGNLRPADLCSRIGGDEFVVVLPNVTEDVAHTVAKRCQWSISASGFDTPAGNFKVSISLGAYWTDQRLPFEDHLARADQALYHSKRAGRDRLSFTSNRDSADAA